MAIADPAIGSRTEQNPAYRSTFLSLLLSAMLPLAALFPASAFGQTPANEVAIATDTMVICQIQIMGNKRTVPGLIRDAAAIQKGDRITSHTIERAKERLQRLRVFRNVVLLTQKVPEGTKLIIVVEEGLNLRFTLTPHHYEKKHGNSDHWYSATLKARFYHFRGRREILWIHTELWDRKALGLGWQQPYRDSRSPYYLWMQFDASVWPHEYENYDGKSILGELGVGRKLWKGLSAYARSSYHNIRTDSAGNVSEHYFPRIGAGLVWDSRNSSFLPGNGQYLTAGCDQYGGTGGDEVDFPQVFVHAMSYHTLPGAPHRIALTGRATKRLRNPPYFYRLYGGGSSAIRGYASGSLRGHNRLTGSAEYRFMVWRPPAIALPYVDYFVPALNQFYWLLEAAVFADAGTYWYNNQQLINAKSAYAFGTGFRVWVPPLQDSGGLDVAWNRNGEFRWHLYWDIEF